MSVTGQQQRLESDSLPPGSNLGSHLLSKAFLYFEKGEHQGDYKTGKDLSKKHSL